MVCLVDLHVSQTCDFSGLKPALGRSTFHCIAPVVNRLTWLNWCTCGAFGDVIQVECAKIFEFEFCHILKFLSHTGNHGLSIHKL